MRIAALLFASVMVVGQGAGLVGVELQVLDAADVAILDPTQPRSLAAALADALPPAALREVDRALGEAERVELLADRLASAPGLAARLAELAAERGFALGSMPPAPAFAGLHEAVVALADAAGLPESFAAPEDLAALDGALPAPLEEAVADLAAGLVVAARLRNEALAGLGPEDLALVEGLAAGQALADDAALADLASRVDLGRLAGAGHAALGAIDAALPRLQGLAHLWTPAAGAVGPAGFGSCAAGYSAPLLDLPPVLALGTAGSTCFAADYILSIDLGTGGPAGRDLYTNNAGSTFTWASGLGVVHAPVAVALDLGGDDLYHSPPDALSAGPPNAIAFHHRVEGSGVLGVGVLVDVSGDDRYISSWTLDTAPAGCPTPASAIAAYLVRMSQGAALVGVGVLADFGGADAYNSHNFLRQCQANPPTDLLYEVTFSQGSGALGLGLLLEAGVQGPSQSDAYNSFNTLASEKQDGARGASDESGLGAGVNRFLVAHVQGAGQVAGAGALVDLAGEDALNSHNKLLASANPSTAAGGGPQSTSMFTAACLQGASAAGSFGPLDPCRRAGIEFGETCVGGLCPGTPNDVAPPPLAGAGILVDALGSDAFNCRNFVTGSTEGDLNGILTQWRATVVQGSVWVAGGLGAMVDARGLDCYNSFNEVVGVHPRFHVEQAQGSVLAPALALPSFSLESPPSAASLGAPVGAGVLVDAGHGDAYNSFNNLQAFPTAPSPFHTPAPPDVQWSISLVQGFGGGGLALGVHLDAADPLAPSADHYNSGNAVDVASAEPAGFVCGYIASSQGSGAPFFLPPPLGSFVPPLPGVGVLADLDSPSLAPRSPDTHNSANIVTPQQGLLAIGKVLNVGPACAAGAFPGGVQGAAAGAGGIGVMAEVGAANRYNSDNDYSFVDIDNALGVGPPTLLPLGIGAFADVSLDPHYPLAASPPPASGLAPPPDPALGPDRYNHNPAPGVATLVGPSVGCVGALAVALDLWDGVLSAPPGAPWTPGLLCVDL